MDIKTKRKLRKLSSSFAKNFILIFFGFIMIYPLIWMFFGTFKTNNDLLGSTALWPKEFIWTSYRDGWTNAGQFTYGRFFINSIMMVAPTVLFTIISSAVTGYGFARFEFPFKKYLFGIMISTMMLPNAVMVIPKFIIFNNLGWTNSYKPFVIPAAFATGSFFIFLMIQFYRGLPRALDEAATIDGCGTFGVFIYILLPLTKPAIISVTIFQFIWTWNDFYNSLIYINSVSKFTVPLALRMTMDITSEAVAWNRVLAMAVLSMIPCIVLFFCCQKYFVEGIATTGIKS